MKHIKVFRAGELIREVKHEEPRASQWIAEEKGGWGLPERDEVVIGEDGHPKPTGKKLPAEYTVQITDITAEAEAEKAKKEADKAEKNSLLGFSEKTGNLTAAELQTAIKLMAKHLAKI